MARRARRAQTALRFDVLESRTLLSANAADELFVRFQANVPAATVQSTLKTLDATLLDSYPNGPDLISVGSGINPSQALNWLNGDPYVKYAEANGTLQASAVSAAGFTPNDPSFPQQWGLQTIAAPQAWTVTTGNPSTIVAVLDTGIDLNNPDLANHLWVNPNSSGADGYPGDVFGWNFVSNNNNVQDVDGHGTHVSAILAAAGNNGYGTAGVDWNARIMVVKVLDNQGNGSTNAAVAGIYFAAQHGAKVINASWGGGPYSQAMADAIAYAGTLGCVFVTAAGNDGTNSNIVPSYPGSYREPNEITVAATDANGNLASFSDYGGQTVDIAAPGVNIVSEVPGGLAVYSGTSMATPFVAGVVALVAGMQPGWNAEQLIQRVLSTAQPDPALRGLVISGGIVNAAAAVNFSSSTTTVATAAVSDEGVLAEMVGTNDFYATHGGTDAGFVTGLYEALTNRAPDPGGLNAWVGLIASGMSRQQVVQTFENTPEALATKVAHWYQDDMGWTTPIAVLKADPGVQYWASLMATGQSDDAVLAQILATNDYWLANGATNTGFLTALYQSLLDRAPDPSGYSYFLGLLDSGASRLSVIQLIQSSAEAQYTKVSRWYVDNLAFNQPIAALKADQGVQYWASQL
jgi:thermitase